MTLWSRFKKRQKSEETLETSSPPRTQPDAVSPSDVIDLRFLFGVWLRWSWIIIPLAAAGLYLGYIQLQAFSPKYTASMIVQPSGSSNAIGGNVGSVISGLGIEIPGGGESSSPFERLRIIIGAIPFAEKVQEKYGLLQEIYGSSWDEDTQTWRKPTSEDFERDQDRRRFFRQNPWSEPSIEDLANFLSGSLVFETVPESQFVEIKVRHPDADFALELLERTYYEADEFLRQEDRIEAEQRLNYVQAQLERQTLVGSRSVLTGMLGREYNNLMLLASNLPYAARIIVPPHVSKQRTEPSIQGLFLPPVVLMIIAGFVLISLIAVFRRG